jgi:SAM-dependent methyltransferase
VQHNGRDHAQEVDAAKFSGTLARLHIGDFWQITYRNECVVAFVKIQTLAVQVGAEQRAAPLRREHGENADHRTFPEASIMACFAQTGGRGQGQTMSEFQFRQEAASTYDRNTGALLSRQLVPWVIRAARIGAGHRVLDIATGTGLIAEAAAALVGPTGHVVAADLSPAMIEQARGRLGALPNVSLEVQNAQSLPYPDESFDAVTCGLGMMFFPDPAGALAEFRRVLRTDCHVAVSVNPDASRTLVLRVLVAIRRRV